jgi:hypothetical protein
MWRKKKWVIIAAVAGVVILVGSIAGVALAQTENTIHGSADGVALDQTENTTQSKTLLARVAEILGIDQQTVENAFTQARIDMRNEAQDNYLKKLVDEGKLTQEQAGEYKTWWQSKPDSTQYQQQLREWEQARPDVPLPGWGGRGFGGGMLGGGRFFGGR